MISCAFFLLHSHVSSCDFTCLRGILISKLFARVVKRGTKSCESDLEETLLYSKVIINELTVPTVSIINLLVFDRSWLKNFSMYY